MTDDATTHDSIDAQTEWPAEDPTGSPGLDRRTVLKGTAAAVAGGVGLAATTGSATAADSSTRPILVFGLAPGGHHYDIDLYPGDQILKAKYAGYGDERQLARLGGTRIDGDVWHWGVDSYRYLGDLETVEIDGNAAFHFPAGAFVPAGGRQTIAIQGQSSGHHSYELATNRGDVEPVTNYTEVDDVDGGGASSERDGTPDVVRGDLRDRGQDRFVVEGPVASFTLEHGHVTLKEL